MDELELTGQELAELDFENLTYETSEGICVITIDRPEALNALNGELLLELGLAFEIAAGDPEVQALIITGSGRAFVAGADIGELRNIGGDVFQGRDASLAGQDVMNTLASLPVPVIAALNGFTLGGGLELALAADLRVAAADAKLGLPEVGLGLIPGYGGTQRLPRLIGMSRALDLILTGRHVTAEEALSLGLVNRVADNSLEAARELAAQMIKNGPIALGLAKEAVVRGLGTSLSQGLEVEADLFAFITTTEDMAEGTSAFLEKRKPEFSGE
jgi:enoyl-CoA hydratase